MNLPVVPQEKEGYLALVLHAQVPYVRLQEGEEIRYMEAMTEFYLPLIESFDRLINDGVLFRITLSVSPILLALLSDSPMQKRYDAYVTERISQAEQELSNGPKNANRLRELRAIFRACQGDIISRLRTYQALGYLELITSTASHALLPLMKHEEAIHAQIQAAISEFYRHFGQAPKGIWLPDCAYTPGIDRILRASGIDYFFASPEALLHSTPILNRSIYAPVITPYGVSAFPQTPECTPEALLTGRTEDCLKLPWVHGGGPLDRKPLFITTCSGGFEPQNCENPAFIEKLCRSIDSGGSPLRMLTPSEYLAEYPSSDTGQPAASSLSGPAGYGFWLQQANGWIYRHLHQAEKRMIRLATQHEHLKSTRRLPASRLKRALQQAARELMLAQSSDWAFMMGAKTDVDYACSRFKEHLSSFQALCDQIENGQVKEEHLQYLEEKNRYLPLMDYNSYRAVFDYAPVSIMHGRKDWEWVIQKTKDKPNIFMLAWEYPPRTVGGLSRAVSDLSQALAAQGEVVHVITPFLAGAPSFEEKDGVFIHRVSILTSGITDFYHWTFEMNAAMTEHLVQWKEGGGRIDLIHAHDWMVNLTAREIKHSFGVPLVATIHATEWGRNHGRLLTAMQQNIHQEEWELTYEASRVIVCSEYMKQEVMHIFELPEDKIRVLPNGILMETKITAHPSWPSYGQILSAKQALGLSEGRVIFSIARLVYEKGIQTLLEAAAMVLSRYPDVKFVIAGTGPMEDELRVQAGPLGDTVRFAGFVDNELRDLYYDAADICVVPSHYEPFGIVALEAMKRGKPVVVSDTGGLAEIVDHGHTGFKALPGHAESLAAHILLLLEQPDWGGQMAENAFYKLEEQYAWPVIASGTREVYGELGLPPLPLSSENTDELFPSAAFIEPWLAQEATGASLPEGIQDA